MNRQISYVEPIELQYNHETKIFKMRYGIEWYQGYLDRGGLDILIKNGNVVDRKLGDIPEEKENDQEWILTEATEKVKKYYINRVIEKTKILEEIRNSENELVDVEVSERDNVFEFTFKIKGFDETFRVCYDIKEAYFFNLMWNPFDESIFTDNLVDEDKVFEQLLKLIRIDLLFK